MKALVKKDLEKKLFYEDIPEPSVGEGMVKIKISYAGICGTDLHILKNEYKHELPLVPGHEFSGIVTETGDGVDNIVLGDRVVSLTTVSTCGVCDYCITDIRMLCKKRKSIGTHLQGVFTDYLVVDSKLVLKIPENVSLEEAALTEPLACVVHGVMEMTKISAGDLVYVSGPGTIGLLAAQIAKAEGGTVVISGTSKDADRLELAKELGADFIVDVSKVDPKRLINKLSDGYGADAALECAGAEASVKSCVDLLRGRGKYLQLGLFGNNIQVNFDDFVFKEINFASSYATTYTSFKRALILLNTGKVQTKSLISAMFKLENWAEAFKMFEKQEGFKILFNPE